MGWSLGANDAANIFGTAVGTRMIRFRTAAIICAIFITLGAVVSGAGAAEGLGALGQVSTLASAFIVSAAAATTVLLMTRAGLPVSTTQAIVGAIVGWNLYAGQAVDRLALTRIVGTWVYGPLIGATIAAALYFLVTFILKRAKIHLITLDKYSRMALIVAGVFGAYSLGANNMANVVGVFIPASPFVDISLFGYRFGAVQQLFLLGGLATALGVATYSKKVMHTIGSSLYKLSPITAIIVTLSTALVLFLFASQELKNWLTAMGLPSLPLVPVSQSQAAVGSVLGIGLAKGGRNLNLGLLRSIVLGWIATPLAAGLLCYIALFFMQNVFMQQLY